MKKKDSLVGPVSDTDSELGIEEANDTAEPPMLNLL